MPELKKQSSVDVPKDEPVVYSVIDKLVFKFDKDILKPAKWAYLSDVKIEMKAETELPKIDPTEINLLRSASRQDGAMVLENANKLIDDNDYEIYILEGSNEVITKLNVGSSFEKSGTISNRRSIENYSADILPSELNVFFKIDEEEK